MTKQLKVSDTVYDDLDELKDEEGHTSFDSVLRTLLLDTGTSNPSSRNDRRAASQAWTPARHPVTTEPACDATLEARSAYNESIRLEASRRRDAIPDRVADDANLVKNTTQRVVAKALGAMETTTSTTTSATQSHHGRRVPPPSDLRGGVHLSLTDDGDVASASREPQPRHGRPQRE
ncbi:hypothetical protein C9J85_04155 [Haloferax sp. wsp5]|nr:hypothetical protein C9J85_04155 [Haloferax sp. wsp5]